MELEQILTIIVPVLSGASGILGALVIFVGRIRSLGSTVRAQLMDNNTVKRELEITRKALLDLNQKITYVVEEAKKNEREEK